MVHPNLCLCPTLLATGSCLGFSGYRHQCEQSCLTVYFAGIPHGCFDSCSQSQVLEPAKALRHCAISRSECQAPRYKEAALSLRGLRVRVMRCQRTQAVALVPCHASRPRLNGILLKEAQSDSMFSFSSEKCSKTRHIRHLVFDDSHVNHVNPGVAARSAPYDITLRKCKMPGSRPWLAMFVEAAP